MNLDRRLSRRQRSLSVSVSLSMLTILLMTILTLGACAGGADREAAEEPSRTAVADAGTEALETTPSGAAASRAYVDPQTGRLVAAPVGGESEAPEALRPERLSRFQEDLIAEPLPEGGFAVDLRGRFQSETVAHLDADGQLRIECVDSQAGAGEPAERPASAVEGGDDVN